MYPSKLFGSKRRDNRGLTRHREASVEVRDELRTTETARFRKLDRIARWKTVQHWTHDDSAHQANH